MSTIVLRKKKHLNTFTKSQLKWLKALESGEYKQGGGILWSPSKNSYCCLGVLCKINDIPTLGQCSLSSNDQHVLASKIYLKNQSLCMRLNDHFHLSFDSISKRIKEQPWLFFNNFEIPKCYVDANHYKVKVPPTKKSNGKKENN